MNKTRTFLLMVSLTILFVVIGGAVGGKEGLLMPRVFVVPERSPNAFATGRNPEHATIPFNCLSVFI